MERVIISYNKMNYMKENKTYLLDEHVYWCWDFCEGFGIIQYNNFSDNFVNSEGKKLLKTNVYGSYNFVNGFAQVFINDNNYYYIDKECNFYNKDKVSFKELYKEYPNMRSELIDIISKYTYYNTEEYFNI